MKKTLSIVLATGMILSQAPAFAADAMESALISVKEKISVPAGLSEFTSSKNEYEGKTSYNFSWSDEESENTISVDADSSGNIMGYYRYSQDWYKGDDRLVINPDFDIAELEAFSKNELEKMVPELFQDETDCLSAIPFDGSLSLNNQSRYTFNFLREYNGVEVKDNAASITVLNTEDGYVVSDANINWDYETKFAAPQSVIGTEAAQTALAEKYAPRLAYRKSYGDDEKYFLEYTFGETKYIDAENAEELKEDPSSNYPHPYLKEENASAMDAGSGGGSSRVTLTPQELAELENTARLKTTNDLLNVLYSMPELGVKTAAAEDIHANTYKNDGEYITSINITENTDKPENTSARPESVNASFNAETGELLSFSRFSADVYSSDKTEDDKAAQEAAYAFLNKYFSEKTVQTKLDEKGTSKSAYCVRYINDIPYDGNFILAVWDLENNRIDSFYSEWDADISKMPAPDNIISEADAAAAAFSKYPAKPIYIISGGEFREVYTFSEYGTRINAFNGKIVGYDGEEIKDGHIGAYTDTDGHWVASIASDLAKYGIAIEGGELRPDEEISQAEFLKLIYSGILGYHMPTDSAQVYKRLINQQVLSDEEINSNAPITRENAIRYLLRAMGIREVAEISGIYICDFADSADISSDKFGYCAIAKGFGIVNGSDGYLYPKANITRAEALVTIYNYLTR